MPPEKKKAQKALPPKPSSFSDEQWALAHSAGKLLELLAAPERAAHSASSKTGEKPLASKQLAALWLCQLLGSSPDAAEEAFKAGAVEICAKLVSTHSSDHTILASLLGVLTHMANPSAGPATSQVRDAIMTVRPAVVPALLSQLEQFSANTTNSSTSSVAAAVGLLSVLAISHDTRLRVTKLLAGWNMSPLVAVLLSQKSLPLEGGRQASSDAAAVLETICAPAATPAAAEPSSGSAKGGKKSKTDAKGSKGASSAALPVGDPVDPTLTAAIQQGVLAAQGISALVKTCAAAGAPAAAQASAAAALQHLMAAHGREAHVKLEFLAAGGLSTMLKIMISTTMLLPARAAAAGCIWQYLAPKPAEAAAAAPATVVTTTAALPPSTAAAVRASTSPSTGFFLNVAPSAANPTAAAAAAAAAASPRGALLHPVTSQEARSNLLAAARTLRKQQQQQQQQPAQQAQQDPAPSAKASSNGGRSASSSESGGRNSVRTSIMSVEAAGLASSSSSPLGHGDQATAAVAAASATYEASLAVWDAAAQAGLAARVDQVIQSGCVPALLLLCCGSEGPPAGLLTAAQAAAAIAMSTAGTDGLESAAVGGGSAAALGADGTSAGSSSVRHRAGIGAAADSASRALGAIVEPSHGEVGTEDEESEGEAADPSADGTSSPPGAAAGTTGQNRAKKGGKKKKAKAKADPATESAQSHASAAVKLLAFSGDAGRAALQDAGARAVLLSLLAGTATQTRWNARQALMALSLINSNKAGATTDGQRVTSQLNTSENAVSDHSRPSSGPSWRYSTEPVKIPNYIAMSNLPASHYQRSAPISEVPLPVLPSIPGRQRATGGSNSSCAAGGVGGSTAAGSVRPNSTARRISMSNLAGSVTAAGRLSNGSFYGSSTALAAGDGQGSGAEVPSASASRVSVLKGPRTSMLAAATGAGSGPVAAPAVGGATGVNRL